MLALLILVQSLAGPPGDDPATPPAPTRNQVRCAPGAADQITVCARSPDADRLHPVPSGAPASALPKAVVRTQLSPGTTLSATSESHDTGFGSTLRVMTHLDVAF